jgi:nucleoside-diphosphate-sugar epimerase
VKALVTGAAGFVGSHLTEWLLASGDEVVGIDSFVDFYPRWRKEENLAPLLGKRDFTFVEGDLTEIPLRPLLEGCDVVYHLAGQPGVRPSWGSEFAVYLRHNVEATQRLLEALRRMPLRKLVFASSSSVYGDAETYPTSETIRPQPVSPYGVTKLAAEHLCELYRVNFGLPTASLRLFTVYGPRQRPDMAFARLIGAAVRGTAFEIYGDGEQTRDFTFVGDVVRAMQHAATSDWCGVANLGGGARTSMNQVIELVQSLCGPVAVKRGAAHHGDVRHTAADTRVALAAFGYAPATTLAAGLEAMVAWERSGTPIAPRDETSDAIVDRPTPTSHVH